MKSRVAVIRVLQDYKPEKSHVENATFSKKHKIVTKMFAARECRMREKNDKVQNSAKRLKKYGEQNNSILLYQDARRRYNQKLISLQLNMYTVIVFMFSQRLSNSCETIEN